MCVSRTNVIVMYECNVWEGQKRVLYTLRLVCECLWLLGIDWGPWRGASAFNHEPPLQPQQWNCDRITVWAQGLSFSPGFGDKISFL